MMLAEPGLVIAAMVKQADEVEVVLQCKRRVDARLVKRSEKDAKAQPRCHGDLLWAIHRLPACRKGSLVIAPCTINRCSGCCVSVAGFPLVPKTGEIAFADRRC